MISIVTDGLLVLWILTLSIVMWRTSSRAAQNTEAFQDLKRVTAALDANHQVQRKKIWEESQCRMRQNDFQRTLAKSLDKEIAELKSELLEAKSYKEAPRYEACVRQGQEHHWIPSAEYDGMICRHCGVDQ